MSVAPAVAGLKLSLPLEPIAALCRKYGVEELSVFGSILRNDFRPDSDIDFLVSFKNNDAGPWMSKYIELADDLSRLLGRKIDLVDRAAVEGSQNYLRREHILNRAKAVYVAR